LPTDYVNSVTERLLLYKELDNLDEDKSLIAFEERMIDRFGPLPKPAKELIETIRLRWLAEKLGLEKLILKNQRLIGYFVSNPTSHFYQSEVFAKMLKFVQSQSKKCKLKEDKLRLSLTIMNVKSIEEANAVMKEILN